MKKRAKLRGRARTLAKKYIAQEQRTGQYPRKQAVAIGISRAKSEIKRERLHQKLNRLAVKYGIRSWVIDPYRP